VGATPPGASLLDRILDPANLAQAWEEVAANAGAPGADRVGIRRFGRNWEERAARLAADVRGGRYRPGPLRVVFIPKILAQPLPPETGQREGRPEPPKCGPPSQDSRTCSGPRARGRSGAGLRRISIPTLTDRLLQRAALQVLMPRLDRHFLSCSYGYRPKRGVAQAVAAVIHYRERGLRFVAEADIDDCFGSLDHATLLGLLAREVPDERVMTLMRAWLAGPHSRPCTASRGRDSPAQSAEEGKGIALGMPMSPLWANLYLHEMDWRLVRNRWSLVRYADDFVVPVASPQAGERALEVAGRALADLKLRLEPTKTGVSSFDEGFTFLGVHFQGNEYTFTWQQKRIVVQGKFEWSWGQYMTWEY
jgi:retron-type reverse transcriptase